MNMSIIDQRPIALTILYSTVRSRSRPRQPTCVVTSMTLSPTSFSTGTMMLAKNTSAASGHMPPANSSSAPPRMVLGAPDPSWITVSTGYTLAGTYRITAAITSAQVRWMLAGLRAWRCDPQRGQRE